LDDIIRSFQGVSVHTGKLPKKHGSGIVAMKKLEGLRLALKQKVQAEEYEEAAKIRDEIRQIEGGANNG
jgi:protein arginine kinase activator